MHQTSKHSISTILLTRPLPLMEKQPVIYFKGQVPHPIYACVLQCVFGEFTLILQLKVISSKMHLNVVNASQCGKFMPMWQLGLI